MVLLPMHYKEQWDWFCGINPVFHVEDSIGMMALRDGVPVAGIVIDNMVKNSAMVHIVVQDPIVFRHGFLEAWFKAAFGEDRQYIFGNVSSLNKKVRKLAKHLKFEEIACFDDAREIGDDMIIIRLKREDCKYLGEHDERT